MAMDEARERRRLRQRKDQIIFDVCDAIVEMKKLLDYYNNEFKQLKHEIKRLDPKKDMEEIMFIRGKCVAYQDHIAEVAYTADMLRGVHRGMGTENGKLALHEEV